MKLKPDQKRLLLAAVIREARRVGEELSYPRPSGDLFHEELTERLAGLEELRLLLQTDLGLRVPTEGSGPKSKSARTAE